MTEQIFHLKNNKDNNFIYKFKPEAFCVLVEAFQTNRSMSHFVKKMLLFSEDILLRCAALNFCLLLKPNFLFPSPTNVPIPCLPHGVSKTKPAAEKRREKLPIYQHIMCQDFTVMRDITHVRLVDVK